MSFLLYTFLLVHQNGKKTPLCQFSGCTNYTSKFMGKTRGEDTFRNEITINFNNSANLWVVLSFGKYWTKLFKLNNINFQFTNSPTKRVITNSLNHHSCHFFYVSKGKPVFVHIFFYRKTLGFQYYIFQYSYFYVDAWCLLI